MFFFWVGAHLVGWVMCRTICLMDLETRALLAWLEKTAVSLPLLFKADNGDMQEYKSGQPYWHAGRGQNKKYMEDKNK